MVYMYLYDLYNDSQEFILVEFVECTPFFMTYVNVTRSVEQYILYSHWLINTKSLYIQERYIFNSESWSDKRLPDQHTTSSRIHAVLYNGCKFIIIKKCLLCGRLW